MATHRLASSVFAVLLLVAVPALASGQSQFTVSGLISTVQNPSQLANACGPGCTASPGDRIIVNIYVDSTTPDSSPFPEFGLYNLRTGINRLEIVFAGKVWSSTNVQFSPTFSPNALLYVMNNQCCLPSFGTFDGIAIEGHVATSPTADPDKTIYLSGHLYGVNTIFPDKRIPSALPSVSTFEFEKGFNILGSIDFLATGNFTDNLPLFAEAGGPYSVNEGDAAVVTAFGSDLEGGTLAFAWDLDNDGTYETPGQSANFSAVGLDGPSSYTITVRVTNGGELSATDQAIINVLNVAPIVGPITAPIDPVQVNTTINASVTFTDPTVLDTHTAAWDWGDNSTSPGTLNEVDGSGTAIGSHTYSTPGVYTVKARVSDDDGDLGESIFQFVVVYDPDGDFVTGGGWINSPAGAYTPDPSLDGCAKFGFVSKYRSGATIPTGQTQFQFQVANLNFHSTSYDWLVVAGPNAKYKGSGSINGNGDYGFMLTARDGQVSGGGGVDRFRIKIWDNATNTVIYDNQLGDADNADASDAIESGSITIHK